MKLGAPMKMKWNENSASNFTAFVVFVFCSLAFLHEIKESLFEVDLINIKGDLVYSNATLLRRSLFETVHPFTWNEMLRSITIE